MNPDGSYTLDIDRFNNDLSYCLNYTPRLKGLYFYDKPSLYLRFFLRGTEENKDERSRERYIDEELAFADAFLVSTEEFDDSERVHARPTPPIVQEAPAAPHPRPTPPNVQEAPAAPLARPTPPIMQEAPAPQTFLPAPALGVAIATPLVPAQAVVQGYLQGRGERKQRAPRSRKPPTATPKQRAPRSRKAPTATPKNGGSAASSLPEPSGWTQAAAHMPQVPEEARLKRRRTVVFPQLWGWGSPSERPLAAAPPVARAECSCFGGSSRGLCSGGCR